MISRKVSGDSCSQRLADQKNIAFIGKQCDPFRGGGKETFLARRTWPAVIAGVFENINVQRRDGLQIHRVLGPAQCASRVAVQNQDLPARWGGGGHELPTDELAGRIPPNLETILGGNLLRGCKGTFARTIKEPSLSQRHGK